MKKTLLLASAAIGLASSQAWAQGGSFEGLTLGLNVESVRSTTENTNTGLSDGSNSGVGSLQAQYGFALGSQFRLGLGITGGIGSYKAGSIGGTDYSTKNAISFDLIPSVALSESMLLYGKVSSLSATGVSTTAGVETTTSISGIGWGLGLRAMVDKHVFLQVGVDVNRYDDKVDAGLTIRRSSNVGSIGLGYKF